MFKPRVIKERTSHIDVEQDLRGLGGSSLFKNDKLQPFLAAHNLDELNAQKLLQKYSCSCLQKKGEVSLIVQNKNHENFKVESLYLFNLGLALIQNKWTEKIEISENDWLKIELVSAINEKGTNHHSFQLSSIPESGILISSLQSYILHQAGYEIQISDSESFLGLKKLDQITNSLLNDVTKSENIRHLRAA